MNICFVEAKIIYKNQFDLEILGHPRYNPFDQFGRNIDYYQRSTEINCLIHEISNFFGFISSDSLYLEKWRWEDLSFNVLCVIEEISFVYTSSTLQHLHIIKSFVQKHTRFHEREIHVLRDSDLFRPDEIFRVDLIFARKEIGGCRIKIICELSKKTFISDLDIIMKTFDYEKLILPQYDLFCSSLSTEHDKFLFWEALVFVWRKDKW